MGSLDKLLRFFPNRAFCMCKPKIVSVAKNQNNEHIVLWILEQKAQIRYAVSVTGRGWSLNFLSSSEVYVSFPEPCTSFTTGTPKLYLPTTCFPLKPNPKINLLVAFF